MSKAVQARLASPSLARTEHFSLHATLSEAVAQELPTGIAPDRTESVDNSARRTSATLMVIVPKRHAKRAVTRNLIKRQMREAARRRGVGAAAGTLLIRQRAAFSPRLFPSAASAALREVVRRELEQLFDLFESFDRTQAAR
jgi:ribonuclease P protein component